MIEAPGGEPMQSEYAQALSHTIKRLEDKSTPQNEKKALGQSKAALIKKLFQRKEPSAAEILSGIKNELVRKRVGELFMNIPPKLHNRYLKRIQGTFSESDDIAKESGLGGVIFELEKINELIQTKNEKVDFELQPLKIDFMGFGRKVSWNNVLNPKPEDPNPMELLEKNSVDFDVPITRNGKPYIYEVKKYGRMSYGSKPSSINQLLKYQEAVNQGKVEGATFEFKGRIDGNFVSWLKQYGETLTNVEIVYILELPSGQEHRFVLKPSNKSAIKFSNPEISTDDDREVVEGINRSIAEGTILDDVSNVDYRKAPEDLIGAVTNPMMNIKTKDQLSRYEQFVREQIYGNLKRPQAK